MFLSRCVTFIAEQEADSSAASTPRSFILWKNLPLVIVRILLCISHPHMAKKEEIIADIIRCVALEQQSDYRGWRIGVTYDVRERRAELRQPERFQYWPADSLKDALAIESYFIRIKSMRSVIKRESDQDPDREAYVYIF